MISYKQYLLEGTKNLTASEAYYDIVRKKRKITPEILDLIKKNPVTAYQYALNILHHRWFEAEKIIAEDPWIAFKYAIDVIQGRFPEAEDDIFNISRPEAVLSYLDYLKHKVYSEQEKLKWLMQEGITDSLFKILNHIGMGERVQRYIIRHKPDLINKINGLDRGLRKKYNHEYSLSGLDI